jgi:hypothetical protein
LRVVGQARLRGLVEEEYDLELEVRISDGHDGMGDLRRGP